MYTLAHVVLTMRLSGWCVCFCQGDHINPGECHRIAEIIISMRARLYGGLCTLVCNDHH